LGNFPTRDLQNSYFYYRQQPIIITLSAFSVMGLNRMERKAILVWFGGNKMRKISVVYVLSMLALVGVLLSAFGVVFPVQAQASTPIAPTSAGSTSVGTNAVAPTAPVSNTGAAAPVNGTVVVPNTGAPMDSVLLSGWTLLIILGVVIVVLLIALLARGSNPPLE
jgi:hypothetical protein